MNPVTTNEMNTRPRERSTWSARALLVTLATLLALIAAACGGDPIPISVPANGESASQPPAAQAEGPLVSTASSDLGDILVNSAGMSIYGFTNDVDGQSNCDGGCASAWPPILVEGSRLPASLDANVFSVLTRADGTSQLQAGRWPLYLFAGDTAPGLTTGHLSGDVWFLAAPDGSLIGLDAPEADASTEQVAAADEPEAVTPTAPALASTASSGLGEILVNGAGLTLYGFTNDVDGTPTCEGGCAEAWPPILVDGPNLPAGLDAELFSVVARPDGKNQLKAGTWPLYLFAGDLAPGQTTGHLSGDVWFVASSTGGLIDGPAGDTASAAVDSAEAPADGYGSDYGEQAATAVAVIVGDTDAGAILVDAAGLSLYGFTNDVDGLSTCAGGCADAWPPVLVDSASLPGGLDAALFSVIAREDGTHQLKAGKWPLYRFAGDTAAGQTTGHLSGDVWFLAGPDGKLIGVPALDPEATAVPAAAATAAPAPTAVPAPAPTAAPTAIPPTPPPAPTEDPYSSDY